MTASSTITESLAARVSGEVLSGDDPRLDDEVPCLNPLFVHSPDAVVLASSEEDVAATVAFAAENGLPVRVQATGHGASGPITDGILISTKALDDIVIDLASRSALIGAGARWEPIVQHAAEHGLAPVTGSSTRVGAVGYTLGGGLGPLARSHGFTSDWVREFRVVTADGDIVVANADEHPDLFWALRGGKGGLGIVTRMTLELQELPTLYAGSLVFDTPHIERALRAWVDWMPTADPRVTTSAAIVSMPPFDEVPEPLRGRTVMMLRFAYPGDSAEGERLAADVRAFAPALIDSIAELPCTSMAMIHNDPEGRLPSKEAGALLRPVDQRFVDAFLAEVGPESSSPFMMRELRHLGNATATDVPEGSAVGGRNAAVSLFAISAMPDLFPMVPAAAESMRSALAEWVLPEIAINFSGALTPAEFRTAWPPEVFDRLSEVRRTYDPRGVFAYVPEPDPV